MRFVIWPLALLATLPSFAELPNETERLMTAARLWVAVDYFHPYLAHRNLDWEGALTRALPAIRAAQNTSEYRAAVSSMLNELHDPETRVLPETASPPPPEQPAAPLSESVMRTAFDVALVIRSQAAPARIVLDLAGMQVAVRLSQPLSNPPDIRPRMARDMPVIASDNPYPAPEGRLLAAIETWGAIHYFFAYKDLMDEEWDDDVAASLQKFIQANDATDYNLALADLLTHLTDSNVKLTSRTMDTYFGEAPVGLNIRLLDKYPIISDVWDQAAKDAGVRPGDVLKRVGGESVTDRFRRFVQYVPASTPQRSGYDTVQRITNGPAATEVELAIENAQGESHTVKLNRRLAWSASQRLTDPVRVLPGNIGYLDLDRLTPEAAEDALTRLRDTKALILDLRGKAAAAVAVARHLTSKQGVPAAFVTTPVALAPDAATPEIATQTTNTFFVRTLPGPLPPIYKAKTIALIDERTIGESEYAGLLFEAANKTEFVGAPSAGAYGSVAQLTLPGAVTITYSTQDVRHGNGGKLQRLGLQPTLAAPTTAAGLRAGKDETLEAAVSYLSR